MAAAFDSTTNAGVPVSGTSVTFANTVPAGGAVVIFAAGTSSSRDPNAVTVNGSAATALTAQQSNNSGANGIHARLWGHVTPATGNIVVTWNATSTCTAFAFNVTGQHATVPFGTPTVKTDNAVIAIASAVGDLVVDGIIADIGGAGVTLDPTGGGDQTERLTDLTTSGSCQITGSTKSGAASVDMNWTDQTTVHIAVNIIAAAGAAAAGRLVGGTLVGRGRLGGVLA